MATKYCHHWDLSESGECAKCGTTVTVQSGFIARIELGKVSGETEFAGHDPSVREALAETLGISPSSVAISDVRQSGEYWDRQVAVQFTLGGSKVILNALVKISPTTTRTPNVVEYTVEEEAPSA